MTGTCNKCPMSIYKALIRCYHTYKYEAYEAYIYVIIAFLINKNRLGLPPQI